MNIRIVIGILLLFAAFSASLSAQELQWHSPFEKNVFEKSTDSSLRELAFLVAADSTISDSSFAQVHTQLVTFCQQLSKKRKKFLSESQFLYYVFKEVQKRYLHTYQPYPLFTSLRDSTYNCVSGTALYAWVLAQVGFDTQIRETNRHVYLRVQTVRSEYLIDATDPQGGFVSDDEMLISKRELWYASNEVMCGKAFNQAISLTQLAGLQYFNEAVKAFNRRSYEKCLQYLTKADALYPNSAKLTNLRAMTQRNLQPVWTASK